MSAVVEFNKNLYDHDALRSLCSNAPFIELKEADLSTDHFAKVAGDVVNQKNTIVTRYEGKYVVLVHGVDKRRAWLISKPALKKALLTDNQKEDSTKDLKEEFNSKSPLSKPFNRLPKRIIRKRA